VGISQDCSPSLSSRLTMECSLLHLVSFAQWQKRKNCQTDIIDATVRKYFIVHMARELNLIFPTATATAMSIRGMHAIGGNAARNATKKGRALVIALFAAIVLRVVSLYAPGILWDWHIFTWYVAFYCFFLFKFANRKT
jgi:hypothetical protein